ncbi:MAG: hypothetical protein OXH57_02920 [Ekhidna sp.]|nr:hypothetical protein [Ekhidna sp.]
MIWRTFEGLSVFPKMFFISFSSFQAGDKKKRSKEKPIGPPKRPKSIQPTRRPNTDFGVSCRISSLGVVCVRRGTSGMERLADEPVESAFSPASSTGSPAVDEPSLGVVYNLDQLEDILNLRGFQNLEGFYCNGCLEVCKNPKINKNDR